MDRLEPGQPQPPPLSPDMVELSGIRTWVRQCPGTFAAPRALLSVSHRKLVMNLNQVTLPARDLGPAVAFYQRLGLRLIVDALPRYVRFECPDGESTLSVEQTAELGSGAAPLVYLECNDLDGTVERLVSEGVHFDSPPTDQPWLWREARLRDPAGNALCLFHAGPNRRNPPWRVGRRGQ